MKKTLASALLLGLTSSAFALPIYTQGGTDVDLYGRFGAYFGKSEATNTDLFDDESRVGLKVSHNLGNDTSAIGGVEFRFSDSNRRFTDPTTHDAYVGLKNGTYGTLTLGRQATTADDIALSKYAYQNENITLLPTQGDRTIKYRSTTFNTGAGNIAFGVDHTFMGTNDKTVDIKSRSTGAGLFYDNHFGDVGFKLNGGYAYTQTKDSLVNATKNINKAWMVGTEFTYGDWALAGDYSQARVKDKQVVTGVQSETTKYDAAQVALKYHVTPETSVFTAYQYDKEKLGEDKTRTHQYTVGVDHKLHKQVIVYAQVDASKVKYNGESDSQVGGAVGMRLFF